MLLAVSHTCTVLQLCARQASPAKAKVSHVQALPACCAAQMQPRHGSAAQCTKKSSLRTLGDEPRECVQEFLSVLDSPEAAQAQLGCSGPRSPGSSTSLLHNYSFLKHAHPCSHAMQVADNHACVQEFLSVLDSPEAAQAQLGRSGPRSSGSSTSLLRGYSSSAVLPEADTSYARAPERELACSRWSIIGQAGEAILQELGEDTTSQVCWRALLNSGALAEGESESSVGKTVSQLARCPWSLRLGRPSCRRARPPHAADPGLLLYLCIHLCSR